MDLGVSRETIEKLKEYHNLLLKWNSTINLISRSSESDCWNRHILDSIQLVDMVDANNIFDFGSGAGLPGIVLAICGKKNINLVEVDIRKCAFLRRVQSILDLDMTIHNCLIEDVLIPDNSIIVSRALFDVSKFCKYTYDLRFNGKILLLKGDSYIKEVDIAKQLWDFDLEMFPSATKEHSMILKILNIRKK